MNWSLISQRNQTQINEDNIRENIKRVEHNYKVGDKVMLNNNTAKTDGKKDDYINEVYPSVS